MKRLIGLALFIMTVMLTASGQTANDFNQHIKAYNSQMASGQYLPAARSAAAAALDCAKAKNFEGGFKLLNNFTKTLADHRITVDSMPATYYYVARARYDLYHQMRNMASSEAWLKKMSEFAKKSGNSEITQDMLFAEAQFYYATGKTQIADRCLTRLIAQISAGTDDKATEKAYKDLIERAVKANDAVIVEHTYQSYLNWNDSVEMAHADTELLKVKKAMAANVEEMKAMDSTITTRTTMMVTFISLFIISLAALALGALFYWRVVVKSRRMKRRAEEADARNAAKSLMMQNLSGTLKPSLDRLDQEDPTVKSLKKYVENVSILSTVETSERKDPATLENVNLEPFCSEIASKFRPKLKNGVNLVLEGTKGWAKIDAPEVRLILEQLLENAVKCTPEGGRITLAYKKRGATSHQFIVSDSGPGIPEDDRENLFTPFSSTRDISEDDGLGLPICAVRADKMGGSLTLDPTVTRGTSFILTIHTKPLN